MILAIDSLQCRQCHHDALYIRESQVEPLAGCPICQDQSAFLKVETVFDMTKIL